MTKLRLQTICASLYILALGGGSVAGASQATPFVCSTVREFLATGDFNGDGRTDIAIVDQPTGGVRYGYASGEGTFDWVDFRWAGLNRVMSIAVGRFADPKADSLVFASGDADYVTLLGVPGGGTPDHPRVIWDSNRRPGFVLAVPVGDRRLNAFDDLYVASYGNHDPMTRVSLFRNHGYELTQFSDHPSETSAARGNRILLKRGGPEYATFYSFSANPRSTRLLVGGLDRDEMKAVVTTPEIPSEGLNDYVVGHFRGQESCEFVLYKRFERALWVCAVSEVNGKFQAGELKSFTLAKPITQLVAVEGLKRSRLLAVFGEQEPAQLMDFDTTNAPVVVKSLALGTNTFLRFAVPISNAFVLFTAEKALQPVQSASQVDGLSYHTYQLNPDDAYVLAGQGRLPGYDRDQASVFQIHERIVASQTAKAEADMQAYTNAIPGTGQNYEMVPILGGEFLMGSPVAEKKRAADEGPQHRVKISPFWMGKYEVTWAQFQLFVYPEDELLMRATNPPPMEVNEVSDAVTRPSKPYPEMSFGMGKKTKGGKHFPTIAMTQHAANKFCHWLSAKTGHFYRLPTEAEWEYAARAGTTNSYFFGDDPAQLPQYAWFFDNADSRYQPIGQKPPNPWGLYDIYGNVAEWVLDQHDERFYQTCADQGLATDPWNKAVRPYPHAVRGGSYDDDPNALRSAARYKSDPAWKDSDPDVPKSRWWIIDCRTVGFRIVRPLRIPPPEEMGKYWNSGVERDVVVRK